MQNIRYHFIRSIFSSSFDTRLAHERTVELGRGESNQWSGAAKPWQAQGQAGRCGRCHARVCCKKVSRRRQRDPWSPPILVMSLMVKPIRARAA